MALEDLEDQMEELEEAVDREGSGTGSGRGEVNGGGFFGFIRKIALWAVCSCRHSSIFLAKPLWW